MLRVFAQNYVYIGRVFQYWSAFGTDSAKLSDEHYGGYRKHLAELIDNCKGLWLTTSETLIEDALEVTTPELTYGAACAKMGEFQRCVEAELKKKLFFFVPPERARYMIVVADDDSWMHVGEEVKHFGPVLGKFQSIIPDLEDAGNCFATGSFTACVYHLMRICEYGLASLAVHLGSDPGVSSWEKLLRKIEGRIKDNDAAHPDGWEQDRTFYSEAATLMINVKNSWRNSVSHIRRNYDEPRARRIFNSVEALMQHLSSRLTEQPLPSTLTLSNPEAEPSMAEAAQ